VRAQTVRRVVEGVSEGEPRPALRVAVRAWLSGMDAAILDWLDTGEITRDELRDLLVATFVGALGAARHVDPSVELAVG
jgi:hypothetical protein